MKTLLTAAIVALTPVTAIAGDLYYSVSAYGVQGASKHTTTSDCLYTMGIMQSNFKGKVGRVKTIHKDLSGNTWVRKVVASRDGNFQLSMTCYL